MGLIATSTAFWAAVPTLRSELVDCPGLGGQVRVRELTAGDRDILDDMLSRGAWAGQFRARVVQLTVVDDNGVPLLGSSDLQHLAESPAGALEPIAEAALEMSGFTRSERAELGKDYGGRAAGSSSNSPQSSGGV